VVLSGTKQKLRSTLSAFVTAGVVAWRAGRPRSAGSCCRKADSAGCKVARRYSRRLRQSGEGSAVSAELSCPTSTSTRRRKSNSPPYRSTSQGRSGPLEKSGCQSGLPGCRWTRRSSTIRVRALVRAQMSP